ncbi:MAG: protease modulator HflC [Micavibrio aeruginosavorus]|uniref:Protease modulator HflC n=1 Tax=Micavibrio aeruginosavorus TaxID=349221 RepID=A0A2W5FEZ4_9BACT|nr:MAG: protease modulator HflC [Micavibrio aeruginosavorus]
MTSVFVVNETQQIMVVRFGNPVAQIKNPGLHFKFSFIDNTRIFEKRILNVDPPAEEVLLTDQKRLVVDTFARYRITDMLMFFQTLGTETAGEQRLNTIINASVRSHLGRVALRDVLSEKRNTLMDNILKEVNVETKRFGVEVVDVRIVRADLPPQVTQSTFDRMQSEREREAKEARAEGEQIALEIRSESDKERSILISAAQRDAQILRGEGDKEAIKIYSDAFSKDPKFYKFYRSLEAYRKSLASADKTLVLTPDSDFFKAFKDSSPEAP